MSAKIRFKIDRKKIDGTAVYKGAKGEYYDFTLMEKANDFGDDGFVVQDLGKERRAAGEKGPIVGNWKYIGGGSGGRDVDPSQVQYKNQPRQAAPVEDDGDEIPF